MTTVVADANILLRLADPASGLHSVAKTAVTHLHAEGEFLCTVPQAGYEFWVVAIRPKANNGLGLSIADCERELAQVQLAFPVLEDKPTLFSEWQTLVVAHQCHGKVAHDARYVAAMRTHGLTHILSFNVPEFARYPGITVLDPTAVAASALPAQGSN